MTCLLVCELNSIANSVRTFPGSFKIILGLVALFCLRCFVPKLLPRTKPYVCSLPFIVRNSGCFYVIREKH